MKKETIELSITEPSWLSAKEEEELKELINSELDLVETSPLSQFIWTARNAKGELVGTMMGSSLYYSTVYIPLIVVKEEYKRHGVAKLLINKVIKDLQTKKFKYFKFDVDMDNLEAILLYEETLNIKLETCYRAEGAFKDVAKA